MKRLVTLIYGAFCYLVFLGTFLYAVTFIGNIGIARTMDGQPGVPFGPALAVNALLLGLFAVQHSVMARPAFKQWWTRIVPPPAERSTYVLCSSAALLLVFHLWQPMGGIVWNVHEPLARGLLYALFAAGWLLVLAATFLINHFDLFGLRQVWLYWKGEPYRPLAFATPGLYRYVRHPLYVGWLMTFWATPTMTVAHLVFAVATTIYIVLAIQWEERDLVAMHGTSYRDYRRQVPMLVPSLRPAPALNPETARTI